VPVGELLCIYRFCFEQGKGGYSVDLLLNLDPENGGSMCPEKSAIPPTTITTQRNNPITKSTSIINHCENLKSVISNLLNFKAVLYE
jgi:hypothetical protein